MTPTRIDLLRHGHCLGGEIFRGHTDSPVSPLGLQQMELALAPEGGWQQILSSPAQRCLSFAQHFSQAERRPNAKIIDSLQEIYFGDWEGCEVDTIYQQDPTAVENFWQDPVHYPPTNGETMEKFNQRIVSAWHQILQQYRGQHILLISHGGVIRCILAHVLGMPLRPLSRLAVPHACLSRIDVFHKTGNDDWPQLVFHRPLDKKN